MTTAQRSMMEHALGFGRGEPGWRNYYVVALGTHDCALWESLVGQGLAKAGRPINIGRDHVFMVTEAGRLALGLPENEETSKAERGGDGGDDSATPLNRLRDARETPMREEGDESLGIPQTVGAQAGDRSQSNAIGSASPSNVLGEPGAGTSIASAAGTGPAGANPVSTIPVPGELCDIDDLPDCLVGGLHQPHCRHAGKTVTIGGNL